MWIAWPRRASAASPMDLESDGCGRHRGQLLAQGGHLRRLSAALDIAHDLVDRQAVEPLVALLCVVAAAGFVLLKELNGTRRTQALQVYPQPLRPDLRQSEQLTHDRA